MKRKEHNEQPSWLNQDELTQPVRHSDYINFFIYDSRQRYNKKLPQSTFLDSKLEYKYSKSHPIEQPKPKNYNSPHLEQLEQKFAYYINEPDDLKKEKITYLT